MAYDEFADDDITRNDAWGSDTREDSFGEQITSRDELETDRADETDDNREGPLDKAADKAREFGHDVKEKFD